ncbi:MAG: urea transporter [Fibrobacterota bacterium]
MLRTIESYLQTLFRSYSYILFSGNRYLGVLLCAVSFLNPSTGLHGITAFTAALAAGEMTGHSRRYMEGSLFLYNPLLIGMAIGFVYHITPLSLAFAAVSGVLTLILSTSLSTSLATVFGLPVLNLPFALAGTVVYLASFRYSNLSLDNINSMNGLDPGIFPLWISAFLKAAGTIFFLPYEAAGLLIILVLLFFSRINVFLAAAGFAAGVLFHAVMTGSMQASLQNPYNFNYIIIALALGGYFLIPSKRTYLITLAAVLISTVFLDAGTVFWSSFGIPLFTLPFALTVLPVLHSLKISRFSHITLSFFQSPEENLENWCTYRKRFDPFIPAPELPFAGTWTVYQSFDDKWTHKGIWRHAVDFVIEDHRTGRTYRNKGLQLSDYLCFAKPVIAPADSTVVAIENSLDDNPIGEVDKENNWGNYIILYADSGYYIEISHLQKGSIGVSPGERVARGTRLGLCGNSGYSPEPHIHFQVQTTGNAGAPTRQFTFSGTLRNRHYIRCGDTLTTGDQLSPLVRSSFLRKAVNMIIEDELTYEFRVNGIEQELLILQVQMSVEGTYYLEDTRRKSRLYYTENSSIFTFTTFTGDPSSPLRFFLLSCPSLPLTDHTISWKDTAPYTLMGNTNPFQGLIKSFHHPLYSIKGEYTGEGRSRIAGTLKVHNFHTTEEIRTNAEIDAQGFKGISLRKREKEYELIRR